MKSKIVLINRILFLMMLSGLFLTACGKAKASQEPVEIDVEKSKSDTIRSNEPVCLVPEAKGEITFGNDAITIDASNTKEGYLYITYTGDNEDVKLQISCDGGVTYTYKISPGDVIVPLTQGEGCYQIVVYEGMGNGQYSTCLVETTDVVLNSEYIPYLYPNYYVQFKDNSEAVQIGKEIAKNCTCDLEVIGKVYDYVIGNITYDHEEALTVASDYIPDVDEILETKKGICFDYASLMAAMLRSQRIPTRLEVGYAGDAYHAWVTTYIEDIGWINGIIQFDGADWTLMDPTFAANADSKTLEEFVGNGDNYTTKYIY